MQSNTNNSLSQMATLILKPLIEVLIRNDFTHSKLTELVRQSYVEVAYEKCSVDNQKMTYSRVAALTGLCRKEVVRLKTKSNLEYQWDKMRSIDAANIVNGWLCDEKFVDGNNLPMELQINGKSGSFESLVNKYSSGIPYKSLLTQLNKAGITSQFNANQVKLNQTHCASQQPELEKVRVMSVCASDLFSVGLEKDKASDNDIRFNWQLVYSGIEDDLAKQFHELGNDKAMALFKTLTEIMSVDKHESKPSLNGKGIRVGLGIYYFDGAKQIKSVKMTSEEHA